MPDEELDDVEMRSVEEQAAGVDIESIEIEPEEVDQCGEKEDYSSEYLTVSSNKTTNPPALCLNTHRRGQALRRGARIPHFPTQGSP